MCVGVLWYGCSVCVWGGGGGGGGAAMQHGTHTAHSTAFFVLRTQGGRLGMC